MNKIFRHLSILALLIVFIGCQNDSAEETSQTPQQQQSQQQQPQQQGPMGQMQQQAPDVDVSDEEAGTFADAAMKAQEVQMQAQQKMIGVIEDEGLDVETYQKIAQSQQMGQQGNTGDFSEDEMAKFNAATSSLEEMQNEIRQDVTAAIEETGMEMQRFQDISRAAQQDSALQMKIQQQMQEKMGGQMQQGAPPQN